MDCKILCSFNPVKDNRFKDCDWINYFKIPMCGYDVPTDKVIDIVRWLQFVSKNPAFV